MTVTVNIHDAKTNFSKLVTSVQQGNKVIIANRGVPVARLEAIEQNAKRPMGFVEGVLPDSFFETLPEDELRSWEL